MKLYCLHEGFYEGVQLRLDQLREACVKFNIDFNAINSLVIDYTKLPKLTKSDLLYNTSRGSETLELLLLNDCVSTFYIRNPLLTTTNSITPIKFSIVHYKIGLPAPKTIYHLTTDRQLLKNYVSYLGGFPVVFKVVGGTRGIGAIKVESWHSLYSTVDYLATTGDDFIMREFIDADYGARIMVLGDEVIASAKFFMQENDFRNAPIISETIYEAFTPNAEVSKICIDAVKVANLEFAGVDILFDKVGNPYLLEINFPTGFSALIDICKVDIPLKMVKFLIEKANERINN
jgi:RimK-like ATP-grasp domain